MEQDPTAKDLKVGSVLLVRQKDGQWKERMVYRASNHAVWFPGMNTSYVTRATVDGYPNTFKIIKL
jgi:hypothetical protein